MTSLAEGDPARAQMLMFIEKLEVMSSTCLADIPAVIRDRKKLAKSMFTWRWMEICPDFLEYLKRACNDEGDGWKSALHISNLLKVDLARDGFSIPLDEAKQIYTMLHGTPSTVEAAMRGLADRKLVIWAPTDQQRLSTLLNEMLKLTKTGATGLDLKLVVPYDPMSGCSSVETLQELWTHPCLQNKFKPFIKSTSFFEQPMRCIFTGPVGPLYHLKSIMIVHCAVVGTKQEPCIVKWKTTLLDKKMGRSIVIDFPSSSALEVQIGLAQLKLNGLLGWDHPRRSPGHSPQTPRLCIDGYFDSTVHPLDIALYIKAIRSVQVLSCCIIGSQSLFEDKTSIVVDFGDIHSLEECSYLFQEALIVSKRKAIVSTLAPKHVWEEVITGQASDNPTGAITCLRFRKALQLPSSIWLKPLLTHDSIQKAKQQAELSARPANVQDRMRLQAQLRVEGLPHVAHAQTCEELMQKVNEATGLDLTKSTSTGTPGPKEWVVAYKKDGEFSQKIDIQLGSPEELQSLIMHVHGSGVRVNNVNLVVEVSSLHPQFTSAGPSALNLVGGPTPSAPSTTTPPAPSLPPTTAGQVPLQVSPFRQEDRNPHDRSGPPLRGPCL